MKRDDLHRKYSKIIKKQGKVFSKYYTMLVTLG